MSGFHVEVVEVSLNGSLQPVTKTMLYSQTFEMTSFSEVSLGSCARLRDNADSINEQYLLITSQYSHHTLHGHGW